MTSAIAIAATAKEGEGRIKPTACLIVVDETIASALMNAEVICYVE